MSRWQDPRFLLVTPFEQWPPEVKNQLVDAVEYTKLTPRGSTGNQVVEGVSEVNFDFPRNAMMLSCPETRFDVMLEYEKQAKGKDNWGPLADADAAHFVLAENFVAHAFTSINFHVNHMPAKTDGFMPYGLPLVENFIGAHLREDAKLLCVTSDRDPFYQTSLKTTDWCLKGTTSNKWSEYSAGMFNDNKRSIVVNYRPMVFPFQMSPATKQESYVVPTMPDQQLTINCALDLGCSNCFTVHPATYDAFRYRVKVNQIELNVAYLRLSAAGERLFTGAPKPPLAQFPGTFIRQYPVFITKGDHQTILNYPGIIKPTQILVQSFSPALMTSGKLPGADYVTRALDHNIAGYTLKWDEMPFYVSTINPGVLSDADMTLNARRALYTKPFFKMPVHYDIGKGPIETAYSQPHLLMDLTNGAGQPIQTTNSAPDAKKGKLSIHLTGKSSGGLNSFYVVSMIYDGCGVIMDRQKRTFTSAYYVA
jgi:hypothetical protein